MTKKFIVHFTGHSCSGKSSVGSALGEKIPGIYTISYDNLKWRLAGYNRDKDWPLVQGISWGLFEVVCKTGIPIQLHLFFRKEDEYLKCVSKSEEYGYSFVPIELTAPKDVLLQRFRNRVAESKEKGIKISITEEAIFSENLAKEFFVPPGAMTFDTSVESPENIADKIVSRLSF